MLIRLLLLLVEDRVHHWPRAETLYLQVLELSVGSALAVDAHQKDFLPIAGKLDL